MKLPDDLISPKSVIDMKKLLVLSLFFPFMAKAQFTIVNTSTIDLVELRPENSNSPLKLQRVIKESDTVYVLEFRDMGYTNDVIMSTLRFHRRHSQV